MLLAAVSARMTIWKKRKSGGENEKVAMEAVSVLKKRATAQVFLGIRITYFLEISSIGDISA